MHHRQESHHSQFRACPTSLGDKSCNIEQDQSLWLESRTGWNWPPESEKALVDDNFTQLILAMEDIQEMEIVQIGDIRRIP
jgi:hypothetical protein